REARPCDRRWRFLRRVEDGSFCPPANTLLCPLADALGCPLPSAIPGGRASPPTAVRWAGKRTLQAAVTRRRNRDAQKQRTSPSACARLRSLIAALACSGDWNMAPNRPGTCERLKTASAAT